MIKYKLHRQVYPNAQPPKRATSGSGGYDLTAAKVLELNDDIIEYDTGLSVAIPPGNVGLVFPRSSVSNLPLVLSNSVGVIDSDYRGTVRLRFRKWAMGSKYRVGDRIGQLVIMPISTEELVEADELDSTDRGDGGFGSTGRSGKEL